MSGFADQWIESLRNVWKRLNGDLVGQLADKVGGNRFVLLDSDGNEILSVDTAGNMTVSKAAGQMFKIDTNGNLVLSLAGVEIFRVAPTGNITVTPLGARFIADFSNGTVSNRFMFQTSSANNQTAVYAIPNGSSATAQFSVANSSDPNNAAILQLITAATYLYLNSTTTGSGVLRPLELRMNSTARVTVGTDGSVDIPTFKYRSNVWTRVTSFTNSWIDARGAQNTYVSPSYYVDETGKVFLTGALSSGTANATAFTLPSGLRPTSTEVFHCAATGASSMCRVDVGAGGAVIPVTATPGTVFLDGISFYPAAYDGSFTAVTFQNSWVNYAGGYIGCGYYKDMWGRVHLRGLAKSGTINVAMFNLPSGYRIWRNSIRSSISNDAYGRQDYRSNGDIVQVTGSNTYVSLAGLMFPDIGVAPESAWQPLGLMVGSWIDYDAASWSPVAYWIDPGGRVHWNGLMKSGAGVGLFNPPAGLTPHQTMHQPIASNGGAKRVEIWPTVYPLVNALPTYDATWMSLGGVSYLRL